MSFAMLMGISKTSGSILAGERRGRPRFDSGEPLLHTGDDKDLTEEEEAIMSSYDFDIVNLGPQSLHANHCMILVLNEMDRRA